jgi:MFS family permease
VLRTLTGAWGLYYCVFFMFYSQYALYGTRELGLAPATLGLVVSIASVGGILSALVTERVTVRLGLGPTLVTALLLATLGMALFPAARGPAALTVAVLLAAQTLIRTSDQLFYINYLSVLQAVTPDRLQGRVNASVRVFTAGTVPLGALLGGALGDTVGLRAVGVVAAAGVGVACLWLALSPVRELRSVPEGPEAEPLGDPPAQRADASPLSSVDASATQQPFTGRT